MYTLKWMWYCDIGELCDLNLFKSKYEKINKTKIKGSVSLKLNNFPASAARKANNKSIDKCWQSQGNLVSVRTKTRSFATLFSSNQSITILSTTAPITLTKHRNGLSCWSAFQDIFTLSRPRAELIKRHSSYRNLSQGPSMGTGISMALLPAGVLAPGNQPTWKAFEF